jgi:hypothetical protein
MRVRQHTSSIVLYAGVVFEPVGGLAVEALASRTVDDAVWDGGVLALPKDIGFEVLLTGKADCE